jgi:hypothetical protein
MVTDLLRVVRDCHNRSGLRRGGDSPYLVVEIERLVIPSHVVAGERAVGGAL